MLCYFVGPKHSLNGSDGHRYAPGDECAEAAGWSNLDAHLRRGSIVRRETYDACGPGFWDAAVAPAAHAPERVEPVTTVTVAAAPPPPVDKPPPPSALPAVAAVPPQIHNHQRRRR